MLWISVELDVSYVLINLQGVVVLSLVDQRRLEETCIPKQRKSSRDLECRTYDTSNKNTKITSQCSNSMSNPIQWSWFLVGEQHRCSVTSTIVLLASLAVIRWSDQMRKVPEDADTPICDTIKRTCPLKCHQLLGVLTINAKTLYKTHYSEEVGWYYLRVSTNQAEIDMRSRASTEGMEREGIPEEVVFLRLGYIDYEVGPH